MFIIARGANGRPTLMHRLGIIQAFTACGVSIMGWSRAYSTEPIPQLLCKRCAKGGEV